MIQTLFGSLDEEKKPSFIERMKEAVSRTRENLPSASKMSSPSARRSTAPPRRSRSHADWRRSRRHHHARGSGKAARQGDRKQIKDVNELKRLLKEELLAIMTATGSRLSPKWKQPEVIVVVGVNGTARRPPSGSWRTYFGRKERRCCCAPPTRSAPQPSSNWKFGASAPGRK